ncbi:MAG TPA: alpha/beta fold hydrolase, partial [Pseudomonadales bacterium]|nr:alpha/beta fold hydrolase [Pseudomonadales bacterium]
MKRFSLLINCLLLLLLCGCASTPDKQSLPLAHQQDYSEEIITNRQGLHLFARTWQPANQSAKANILIFHGTALHGGVYEPVAKKLNAAGFRVFALDMQGWGRSEGKGAPGYVENFDDYVKDAFEVLN